MSTILIIQITSHERPYMLSEMLKSLSTIIKNPQVVTIVADNSIAYAEHIKEVCRNYSQITLFQNPGFSQNENFCVFLNHSPSKFVWLLHDDDVIHIGSSSLIDQLSSDNKHSLFYIDSSGIDDLPSFRNFQYEVSINHNVLLSVFPYKLPCFPSVIYERSPHFEFIVSDILTQQPCGKYSDTVLLCKLLQSDYSHFTRLAGSYFFRRVHKGQDVGAFNFADFSKLAFYVLSNTSVWFWPKILFFILRILILSFCKRLF